MSSCQIGTRGIIADRGIGADFTEVMAVGVVIMDVVLAVRQFRLLRLSSESVLFRGYRVPLTGPRSKTEALGDREVPDNIALQNPERGASRMEDSEGLVRTLYLVCNKRRRRAPRARNPV